ncbi:MAG: hypothetical protein ABR562_02075 [Thermoplasmatota archaeon]
MNGKTRLMVGAAILLMGAGTLWVANHNGTLQAVDPQTGAMRARIDLGGANPRTLNLRYTDVWVKGPSGWRMVAWQSTPLPAS